MGCRLTRTSSDAELEIGESTQFETSAHNPQEEKQSHRPTTTTIINTDIDQSSVLSSKETRASDTSLNTANSNGRSLVRRDTPAKATFGDRNLSKSKFVIFLCFVLYY